MSAFRSAMLLPVKSGHHETPVYRERSPAERRLIPLLPCSIVAPSHGRPVLQERAFSPKWSSLRESDTAVFLHGTVQWLAHWFIITARPRLLSVTESIVLPPPLREAPCSSFKRPLRPTYMLLTIRLCRSELDEKQ
jgi:hypothetical protein